MLKNQRKSLMNVVLLSTATLLTAACGQEEVGGWSNGDAHWCFWDDGEAGFGDFEQNVPRYTWDDGTIEKEGSTTRFTYTIEGDKLVVEAEDCEGCDGTGTFTRNEEIDCTRP